MAKKKSGLVGTALEIEDRDTLELFEGNALEYGRLTLEDRALPDYRDGLLKVYRRTLFAASHIAPHSKPDVKTARIVGDTLSKYHPHGDMPVQGAIETLVWSPLQLIEGSGNWGTQTDDAAAMRYTNCRLSEFSQRNFFDKYFEPTIKYHPNYDGKDVEPELLPSLLPNVILNGSTGNIAMGLSGSIPAFAKAGVIKLIKGMLSGKTLTAKACYANLDMVFSFGGNVPKEDYNEDALMSIFKTGKGSVYVYCDYDIDPKERVLHITGIPPKMNPDTLMNKLRDTEYFSSVQDNMGRYTSTPADVVCKFKKGINIKEAGEDLWENILYSKIPFQIAVVERKWDEEKRAIRADIYQWGVIEMLENWIEWRMELEAKMLVSRKASMHEEIRRRNLLLIAQENRKVIATSWESEHQKEFLASKLNVNLEDAGYIVGLRLSQLGKLDRDKLAGEVAEIKKAIKRVEHLQTHIEESILESIDGL